MRIVAIGDTHTKHRKLQVPDGDVLLFAGDGEFRSALVSVRFSGEAGKVILSAATTFLIRITDVANEILNFKSDDKIKKLFDEAKRLS